MHFICNESIFLVREKVLFGMFDIYVLFPINTSAHHQTYKFSKYHKKVSNKNLTKFTFSIRILPRSWDRVG